MDLWTITGVGSSMPTLSTAFIRQKQRPCAEGQQIFFGVHMIVFHTVELAGFCFPVVDYVQTVCGGHADMEHYVTANPHDVSCMQCLLQMPPELLDHLMTDR